MSVSPVRQTRGPMPRESPVPGAFRRRRSPKNHVQLFPTVRWHGSLLFKAEIFLEKAATIALAKRSVLN